MKIVEMKTEDLEYYINLLDKAAAWFERIDFNFERSSFFCGKNTVKQHPLYASEKLFLKERVNLYANFTAVSFPSLEEPSPVSASIHQY